jgi:hypothetical protein
MRKFFRIKKYTRIEIITPLLATIFAHTVLIWAVLSQPSFKGGHPLSASHNNRTVKKINTSTRTARVKMWPDYMFSPIIIKTSKIAHIMRDTMDVGKEDSATLIITQSSKDTILFQSTFGKDKRKYKRHYVKSPGSKISVTLIDPTHNSNFDIHPLRNTIQRVDDSTITRWEWSLTPQKPGDSLKLIFDVAPIWGEAPKDTTFATLVHVNGAISGLVGSFAFAHIEFVLATFLFPILLWLIRKWKDCRRKKRKVAVSGFSANRE